MYRHQCLGCLRGLERLQQGNAGLYFTLQPELPQLKEAEQNPGDNGARFDCLKHQIRMHCEHPLAEGVAIKSANVRNGRTADASGTNNIGVRQTSIAAAGAIDSKRCASIEDGLNIAFIVKVEIGSVEHK